ncbi:MAG: NADH-quinone oxidoreductase subunit NuoE [Phycisphaerales bacterium]|nr:MAG: NADH-quinone oxidoreductase subunit NuoE [Phycisphaerales bacterium]
MTTAEATSELGAVLSRYDGVRSDLIPILQDVQDELGYLPEEAVATIAEHLNLSKNDVFGVATFFTQFRFNAPGEHCIKVCQGTACHVRGSGLIVDELSRKLGVAPGQTTADRKFSLERVACYGSCALAPVVIIDDKVHGRMDMKKTEKLIEETA